MNPKLLLLSVLVILALAVAQGCGGSSSPSSSGSTSSSNADQGQTEGQTQGNEGSGQTEANRDGVLAEFRIPGGLKKETNQILVGGKEGDAEDREAASRVLEESFDAREHRDWTGQCATLSEKALAYVETEGSPIVGATLSCVKSVKSVGEKASPEALANNMKEPVAVLRRVNKTQAFAFYHGTDGKNYLIPVEEDKNGERKVASLAPEAIPGS